MPNTPQNKSMSILDPVFLPMNIANKVPRDKNAQIIAKIGLAKIGLAMNNKVSQMAVKTKNPPNHHLSLLNHLLMTSRKRYCGCRMMAPSFLMAPPFRSRCILLIIWRSSRHVMSSPSLTNSRCIAAPSPITAL